MIIEKIEDTKQKLTCLKNGHYCDLYEKHLNNAIYFLNQYLKIIKRILKEKNKESVIQNMENKEIFRYGYNVAKRKYGSYFKQREKELWKKIMSLETDVIDLSEQLEGMKNE